MSEMADSQPPEGLRKIVSEAVENAPCVHAIAYFREHGVMTDSCSDCVADAVLAALFEACEVREERRIVIDDERASGLPVNGLWITPPAMVGTHHFLLGRYPSARIERRFVIETAPEPVLSDNSEATR